MAIVALVTLLPGIPNAYKRGNRLRDNNMCKFTSTIFKTIGICLNILTLIKFRDKCVGYNNKSQSIKI